MATATSLIDLIYNAFYMDIPNTSVKVVKSFAGNHQDLPIYMPVVAIGIGGLRMTGPLDGNGQPQDVNYAQPLYGRFTVRADICVPVKSGSEKTEQTLDKVLSAARGLSGGIFTVNSIECGETKYSRVLEALVTTVNINMQQTLYQ